MNTVGYSWFERFLASIWLIALLMLGIGVNHAFVADIRDMHGKIGLLNRPTTEGIEWKVDNFLKSLVQPVEVRALDAVFCTNCLNEGTYTASRVAEKAEITLLRTILTSFVRTILNFIQNFVLNIIKQLTSAQDQFNFLKSIGQYAEQAVLLASNQAYNCATQSITTWSYKLFGETPPPEDENECKFGLTSVTSPTDTEVVGATQSYIEQCAVLNFSSVKPNGCTQTELEDVKNQRDETIKEKVLQSCTSLYTAPLYQEITGPYACSDAVLSEINKVREESDTRIEQIKQNAAETYDKYKFTAGGDAAFISSDSATSTPSSSNFADGGESSNTSNPVFFPTSLDVFDPNTSSTKNLQIGFATNPNALAFANQYTAAAINSKPQPGGEAENIITTIQDAFKGFLDQLLQKLQEMLFSFLNSLIAKLDLATGGSGIFSSLLSDVTGAVKTYAKTKVNNLYNDITIQRQNLIDGLSSKKQVINNSTQDVINSNIAFIA